MKNKKILFVTYGGGHAQLIKSIVLNLPAKTYNVLCLTSATEHFDEEVTLDIKDVYRSIPKEDKKQVLKIKNFILKNNLDFGFNWDENSLLYYSLGALEYVKKNSFSKIKKFHWNRHLFLQTQVMVDFLNSNRQFCLVISTTSPRFERAAVLASKKLNIDSIQIDDMFVNNEAVFLAKKVIVSSKHEKNKLHKRGHNVNDIFALGNPIFEHFNNLKFDPKTKKSIYFCPNKDRLYDDFGNECFKGNDYENHYKEFTSLSKFMNNNPDYSLIVRPHPNDSPEDYLHFLSICNFKIITSKEENLKDAMFNSALWITQASTTGIQASLAGIPVITYCFRQSDSHSVPRMTEPPFHHYNSLESLDQGFNSMLVSDYFDNKVNKWPFLKNSSNRIVNFIMKEYNRITTNHGFFNH